MIEFILAITFSYAYATPAKPVPAGVLQAAENWKDVVAVPIRSAHCGDENAWYDIKDKYIVLCDELFDRPLLARAILNHELAHAFFYKYGVPDSEFGADELGAFFMTQDERYAVASWFIDMGPRKPNPSDPHPTPQARAGMFLCLDDGLQAHPTSHDCEIYAQSALEKWLTIFALTVDG